MDTGQTNSVRQRFLSASIVVLLVALSWLGMMAVHELGHVVAAWVSGGSVMQVVLHPLAISRTDVLPNPHPLVVVWGGPIVGVLLPVMAWAAMRAANLSWAYLLRFFAGFCLIANGAYIGAGSFDGVGDAGEMLHVGTPIWALWLFGIMCVPAGLALWHGLGPRFGIGNDSEGPRASLALALLALLVGVVVSEVLLSARS
jgi:hypothetical protein